jgi:hypothetical protein
MDETSLKIIEDCGKLKYNTEKICNILGLNGTARDHFLSEFDNPVSEIRFRYNQGVDTGDYNIDIKLQEMAEKGEVAAIEELRKRKHFSELSKLKKDLFGV